MSQEDEMARSGGFIIAVASMVFSVACGMSAPTAPTMTTTVAGAGLTSTAPSSAGFSVAAVSCTVDIGSTTRPLPALHLLANWINLSLSSSTLTCGEVRSLAAKLQQIVAALDQESQNFNAACGISTSLVAEVQALESTGQLAVRTFTLPPAAPPDTPTTVLGLAELTSSHFCEAARGGDASAAQ
jgi:hypothetical protein